MKKITREQFIAEYSLNSSLPLPISKTLSGCFVDGHERIAVECRCGYSKCQGWQMRSVETLLDDLRTYGRIC